MIKLIQILSEIRIHPKITKDLARKLWLKVVNHPKWDTRDRDYMKKYDQFLINQMRKHNQKVWNKEIEGKFLAGNIWDMIEELSKDELKDLYIELSKLVNEDKINEIKIQGRITPQDILDLIKSINNDKGNIVLDLIDIYDKYGFYDYKYFPDFERWLESLSQSQLNLLYSEITKIKYK